MIYKEDIQEAKQRMDAWWDHELTDRSVISYFYPRLDVPFKGIFDPWCLAKNYDGIEHCIKDYEEKMENIYHGGEAIPVYYLNYGPGITAAVLGVIPEFKSQTVWFNRPTEIEDIVSVLENVKLDGNNEWYNRLLNVSEFAAKRAQENYQVSVPSLSGVLDILASFLGPTKLIIAMKKYPNIVDTCRAIILEKMLKLYDNIQDRIEKYCHGCSTWLMVWCRKRYYTIQCDFAAFLSPEWFKRFVMPDLEAQAEHLDYAIYHLDGPKAIPHLDILLESPSITAIQWVPGAGKACDGSEQWMPLYKKIQKAGKNIVMDPPPELLPRMYKVLDQKGLYCRTIFLTKPLADCYLPEFVGGDEGKNVDAVVSWINAQKITDFKRKALRMYLSEQNIELDKDDFRTLFSETKKALSKQPGVNISDMGAIFYRKEKSN